jgi:hypothetical protein
MFTPASIRFTAAAFFTVLGVVTGVAAQAAPADVWKMVPAAPTTCYPDDGFNDKLNAAAATIQAEIERQTNVNAAAREKFANMDMTEKAQRMQAFMMKNPQQAMKMLQAEQAAGAAASSSVPELNESAQRLDAELTREQASFRAAAEQAVKPLQAAQEQLIDAKTVLAGEAQISMFTAAADHAQYVQLLAEEDAAYEKACAPYFGADGTFHKWLNTYRTDVLEKLIGHGESVDAVLLAQMAAMDVPGGGYRSTVALEQSLNYLTRLRNVFDVRRSKARAVVELRK